MGDRWCSAGEWRARHLISVSGLPIGRAAARLTRRRARGEDRALTFPQIVGTLLEAGFESYAIDFRRATATCYLADGDGIVLPTRQAAVPGAPRRLASSISPSRCASAPRSSAWRRPARKRSSC
jgi:hypothetical protein